MRQNLVVGKQKSEIVEIVDESSETSDDEFEFPKESDTKDYSVHESTLDQDTGIDSETVQDKDRPGNVNYKEESENENKLMSEITLWLSKDLYL